MNQKNKNQHAQQFIDALNSMQLDPMFNTVSRLAVSRNWLNYVGLTETQKCALLEWLLKPNEGHGLGDYFIRQLLLAVYQKLQQDAEINGETLSDRVNALNLCQTHDALNSNYSAAFVDREITLPDNESSRNRTGRVDLIIYDEIQKTLIVIERKDGSKLSPGQLEKYRKYFSALYDSDRITQYYLLLDSCEQDHSKTTPEEELQHWIQLGDDWLKSAINHLLQHGLVPKDIGNQLCHIRDYVLGYWNEESEPYYKDSDQLFLNFLHDHQQSLTLLNEASIQLKNGPQLITWLDGNRLFNEIQPSTPGSPGESLTTLERQAISLYTQHLQLLSVLNSYGAMSVLETAINKAFSNNDREYFATEIDRVRKKQSLCLCPDRHIPNAQQALESEWWPYTLEIVLKEAPQEEDTNDQSSTVQVILNRNDTCAEELKPLANQVWQTYLTYFKEQSTTKLKMFKGQSQVLASFEGQEHLKLTPGEGIYPYIEAFKQITHRIDV